MEKNKTVCVLIDVQERLLPHMHNHEQLLDSLTRLLKGMAVLEIPVIWNEQYPKGLGPTVKPLAEILEGNSPLIKNTFSCCGSEGFLQALKESGADYVIAAGIEAHVCVFQTVRDLLSRGYHVELVSDCVSSRTKKNRDTALQRVRDLKGEITSMEMVLFDLLKNAEGEVFKQISRIVK